MRVQIRTAPEILRQETYDKSVDVYSFGIVMWECWTRDQPFKDIVKLWDIRFVPRLFLLLA
jgi:serine/threonine protein kinase